jgi:subtilisin family serine protease
MAGLADIYRFELPPDADMAEAVRVLSETSGVEFAQPDYVNTLDVVLDDPFLSSAGAWGQPFGDLWGLDRIRAPEAWSLSQGEGVVIAVVDTGLDSAHPDMAANVWVNPGEDLDGNGVVDPGDWNGIDDDGNGFVDDLQGWNFVGYGDELKDGTIFLGTPDTFDDNGHGSHVAGTAAAVGNNGIGIAGVAPRARVMALKGFPAQGSARDSDLWRAVLYAIEHGARVVNGSWSCSPFCPQNPLAAEVLAIAEAAGVVFVSSAGNASRDVIANAPENTRAALTVGSIGFDDEISNFSNTGFGIDIVAPGGGPGTPRSVFVARRNILSIRSSGAQPTEEPFFVGDAYLRMSGTSMAAPAVAGAVAVLLAQRPDLSVAEVRRLMRLSARDKGEPGHDAVFGPGVLDLRALLETESPALRLEIDAPVPTQILDPTAGPIEIRGLAAGADLRSFALAYARGLEGGEFLEIEAESSVATLSDGLLARWDASSLEDGPIVIRLRGELRDGRTTDEFVVASLERNRPLRLSGGEGPEFEPSLSGDRVAWTALGSGSNNVDVAQIGGFRSDGDAQPVRALAESERSQRSPLVSRDRVVWIERDPETADERLMSCRIGAARSSAASAESESESESAAFASRASARRRPRDLPGCRPIELARSEARLDPLRLVRDRVLWSTRDDGLFGILQCVIRGSRSPRGCSNPRPLPDASAADSNIRLLDFDGETVVWSRGLGSPVLELCVIDPRRGTCAPVPVSLSISGIVDSASIDSRRLAVELFRIEGSLILSCNVDLRTGECNLGLVGGVGSDPGSLERGIDPVVSGNRIAWQRTRDGEPSSIAFCEIDPIDGECRPQRVTGGFMPSSAPDLDGDRLVWEDQRFGPSQILGTELPRLRTRSSLRVRAGGRAVAWIESSDPAGGPLDLRLEAAEGLEPEAVGARLFELGSHRLALLLVDPDRGAAGGTGRWRLIGEARGGWTTQRAIDVTVLPTKRPARPGPRDGPRRH